jgi:hypothetical protein
MRNLPIAPIFIADTASLAVSREKDWKLRIVYAGWDNASGLLQNELVQRQIRDGLAQPAVLERKVLQALHLLGPQPAELLAPPIIRHLTHPDLADCVHHVLALRDQNIDLPQLRDDLFRLVSLPCHYSPP